MLVLTRKRSQTVKIGDNIVITVLQLSRGMVKLGIEAPSSIRVLRAELTEYASVKSSQQTTAQSMLNDEQGATAGEVSHRDSNQSMRIDYSTDLATELEDQMFSIALLVD
jgi:carbon storage regulator